MDLDEKIETLGEYLEPYITGNKVEKKAIYHHFIKRIKRISGPLFESVIDDMISTIVDEYFYVEIISSIEEIDHFMDEMEQDLDIIEDTELARKLYPNAIPIEDKKLVLNYTLLKTKKDKE